MSKSSNIVCSLIAAALLAGCAAGTNFEFDQARKLQIGMSESEVTSLIGKPYSVVSKGTEQIWVWSYYETFSGQSKTLSVIFENGKTKQVPNIPESFELFQSRVVAMSSDEGRGLQLQIDSRTNQRD